MVRRYVNSVLDHPAGCEYENLMLCQKSLPDAPVGNLFDSLPEAQYLLHDDQGWDIGGYVKAAGTLNALCPDRPMLCLGGSATVRKPGWLSRLMEAWDEQGPGIYGTQASYQCRPHLNTSGFMCLPVHLLRYPRLVFTRADRYNFEHGMSSWWEQMYNEGEKVKLVTWDGIHDWPEWRTPPNISCRGDQSNCLTYFRINYDYENGDAQAKLNLEQLTDRLTDKSFQDQLIKS